MTHQDPHPAPAQPPADVNRLVTLLDSLTDSRHGEDCKAYGKPPDADADDDDEIDDNPLNFLEHCDCGLKDAFEAWKIAKALSATPVPGPAALTWTREKPTKPGWYWRTTLTSEDHVHVTERGGDLYFSEPGETDVDYEHPMDAADRLWSWAGPIPEPTDSTPSTQATP